ncbi:MAG: VWA domain-containing protein [Candidatus Competibacteraceae bacterium]|nr:VWA domain-containing protein [Candidatus Competibacteraceae bacterium]
MRRIITNFSSALALLGVLITPAYADSPSVLFVLDGSGSMWGKVGDQAKIEIAKTVMTDMVEQLPSEVSTGLLVYGHNRKDDCEDIAMVAPVGSERTALVQALNDINPKGKTPLTGAVQLAARELRQSEGSSSVVVVSDGKETCEGDPCSAAREAANSGVDLRIHVVGFDVTGEETEQLNCIAKEGKGKYFAAANSEQLVAALSEVQKEVVAAPPPPPPVQVAETTTPAESEVIFEDRFDRDELGELWEVINPDPNRLALSDEKLLIVATKGDQNIALVQTPVTGDFVATVKVDTPITQNMQAGMYYWIDAKNYLLLGPSGDCCPHGRWPVFRKIISGQKNDIRILERGFQIGSRGLEEYAETPETWYLQIERSGVKYTGRMSVDGQEWTDVGTHTVLQKTGRIGVGAHSSRIENAAEFDDLVLENPK